MTVLGVDIARSGSDKNVLAVFDGVAITNLITWSGIDTMKTVGRIINAIRKYKPSSVVIDVIGIGAGVFDRLREQDYPVVPFNASEKTDQTDRSGEKKFINKRAASWWMLRELLEDGEIALPPDEMIAGLSSKDSLTEELVAPKWDTTSAGRTKIESKADIKKQIGRSTDYADAVIMAVVGNTLCKQSYGGKAALVDLPW